MELPIDYSPETPATPPAIEILSPNDMKASGRKGNNMTKDETYDYDMTSPDFSFDAQEFPAIPIGYLCTTF